MQLIYTLDAWRLYNGMYRKYKYFNEYKYLDAVLYCHKKEHVLEPFPSVLQVLRIEGAHEAFVSYYKMKLRELRNILCN